MTAKPFKVINCLSQGFAVAGPPESEGPDLEMVLWGVDFAKARAMADELNEEAVTSAERRRHVTE